MFKLSIAISALFLSSIPLLAQTPDKEDSEIKAVRHVAELYISGDPTNLIEAFYPSSNLFTTDEKDALRTIPFTPAQQKQIARLRSTLSIAPETQPRQRSPLSHRTQK
jgi:hypothetical protein